MLLMWSEVLIQALINLKKPLIQQALPMSFMGEVISKDISAFAQRGFGFVKSRILQLWEQALAALSNNRRSASIFMKSAILRLLKQFWAAICRAAEGIFQVACTAFKRLLHYLTAGLLIGLKYIALILVCIACLGFLVWALCYSFRLGWRLLIWRWNTRQTKCALEERAQRIEEDRNRQLENQARRQLNAEEHRRHLQEEMRREQQSREEAQRSWSRDRQDYGSYGTFPATRQNRESAEVEARCRNFRKWVEEATIRYETFAEWDKFPTPPPLKCPECGARPHSAFPVCEHTIQGFLQRFIGGDRQRQLEYVARERKRWHPDKFSCCRQSVKVEIQKSATAFTSMLNGIYDRLKA